MVALWVAPAAKGLFQRMILQSDPFVSCALAGLTT